MEQGGKTITISTKCVLGAKHIVLFLSYPQKPMGYVIIIPIYAGGETESIEGSLFASARI